MIVVGCGKAKLPYAAPARELYCGSLFQAARRYAEARGQRWLVMSAKLGIIEPDAVIEPYEQRLAKGFSLELWAAWVACSIVDRAPRVVEILAGVGYARPVARELGRAKVAAFEPMSGLGLGQRLRWLNQAREREQERAGG